MASVLCSGWNPLRSSGPRKDFNLQANEYTAPKTKMARADCNGAYLKWARMKQITGFLDFIDEHIDEHGVSVVQILAQVDGDIR